MPHAHPLHADVRATCECCGSVQPFRFTAASEPVVCAACRHHLGAEKAERRDREHIALWSALLSAESAAHEADAAAAATRDATAAEQLASQQRTIAELGSGLLGRYEGSDGEVVGALQGELVKRAERRAELVDRKLDRMMAVLWRLARLHHGEQSHPLTCSCGESLASCAVGRIIDGERRAIDEWEARNLALATAGKRHALPPEHPAHA